MICPLCGGPIQWKKTDLDGWVPCDQTPVLFTLGGKLRLVKRRDLVHGQLYTPGRRERPQYAWMPHYYTCPVLRRERREWAIHQEGYHAPRDKSHRHLREDQEGGLA